MKFSPKRVLLKISGEALSEHTSGGISSERVSHLISSLLPLIHKKIQVAIVIGGGNFFRGGEHYDRLKIERTTADQVGMLATVMNALIFQAALSAQSIPSKILSAFQVEGICEKYQWQKGRSSLENGELLLLPGGTSHPFFTTDTAAALRATELKADLLLKATTQVDGIYDSDPRKKSDARKFAHLSYQEYLERGLQALDLTAISLCQQNHIPVLLYNAREHSFEEILNNPNFGTLITDRK